MTPWIAVLIFATMAVLLAARAFGWDVFGGTRWEQTRATDLLIRGFNAGFFGGMGVGLMLGPLLPAWLGVEPMTLRIAGFVFLSVGVLMHAAETRTASKK